MRKKLFSVIESADNNSKLSNIYDFIMMATIGRVVTMVSSAFGIAIIALPSGVITAGYLAEINKEK